MVLVTVLRNVALAGVSMGVHVPEDTEFAAPVSTYLTPDIQSSFFKDCYISVQLNCGQSSSENCTYFQSSGSEVGQCRIKICPCSDNICQLRLDFQNFVINQPKTTVESVQKINSKLFYDLGQCQTDLFTVTAPGNTAPPGICGTNSGEHSKTIQHNHALLYSKSCLIFAVFVDASDMCNDLGFNLGGTGSTITQRSWTIKVQ